LKNSATEDLLRVMDVNAWSPLFMTLAFFRRVKEGKVVNVLDTIINGYNFDRFPYFLSKKALETLTKALALKMAPHFTVNAVAPGLILPPTGKDEKYLEGLKTRNPLRRIGSVAEVAAAVEFLLMSDFITGQVIFVDGGEHLIPRAEGI